MNLTLVKFFKARNNGRIMNTALAGDSCFPLLSQTSYEILEFLFLGKKLWGWGNNPQMFVSITQN